MQFCVCAGAQVAQHRVVLGGLGVVFGGLRFVLGGLGVVLSRVRGCIGRRVFTCACRVQWLSFETNLGVYFHHGLVFSWWRPAARNSKHHNPAHVIANLLHSPVMMFGSRSVLFAAEFCLCARHILCTQNIVGFVDHPRRLCSQHECTSTIDKPSSDTAFLACVTVQAAPQKHRNTSISYPWVRVPLG